MSTGAFIKTISDILCFPFRAFISSSSAGLMPQEKMHWYFPPSSEGPLVEAGKAAVSGAGMGVQMSPIVL